MKPSEYLRRILEEQTFKDSDQEMKDLRERRADVEKLLRDSFPKSSPSIRWGGSNAKGTMIRESYDGDLTCYFENGDTSAGESLEDLFENAAKAVETEYLVDRKTSALRVRDKSREGRGRDSHIDVVPGRFTDDEKSDVFLHQNGGSKERLKTNLETHVKHISTSGVRDAIRLVKLWNVRHGVGAKTFVLELLVVKLLKGMKTADLSDQLNHLWTEFSDSTDDLAVEDPANPSGNDLKPILDMCRYSLASIARSTLLGIDATGWESVFGPPKEEESLETKAAAIHVAVRTVATPTKPWCREA